MEDSKNNRTRHVLEGVPKIAFSPIHDGKYELTPFPSCLKACLKYLNEDYKYSYLVGVSGAAFRLVWHSKRWEGGNIDIMYMTADPLKPFNRALEAVGYSAEILLNYSYAEDMDYQEEFIKDHYADEETMKQKIMASLDQGIPVIGLGVVGPPEASIITGYDNSGDRMIGWSMFQDFMDLSVNLSADSDDYCPPTGFEDSEYFYKDGWYFDTLGVIILKKKKEIDRSHIYRQTLMWISEIINTPMVNEFYTGLRAYDEYITKMKDDTEFPLEDLKALNVRKNVHYDAMTMIAERGEGAVFMKNIAKHVDFLDMKSELLEISTLLEESNLQMKKWWDIIGPLWNDEVAQIQKVADSKVRNQFVTNIAICKQNDEKILEILKKCLAK